MNAIELRCLARNEDDTERLGRALAPALRPGDTVALHGPLGAGKTRLVRAIAAGMGVDPAEVSSPTFVIAQEYGADAPERGPVLIHADAYRLASADELASLGWEGASDPAAVTVIEWAERIGLPAPAADDPAPVTIAHVTIEPAGETRRRFFIRLPPAWTARGKGGRRETIALIGVLHSLGAALPTGWATCPTTGSAVPPWSETFPFRDERARMADLGRWLSGSYTVSRELTEDDLNDPGAASE